MARAAAARTDDPFLPFLTAYDPSDLPGTSVDPLGFDRGYNFLADQILPGLTNVARQPRYFGLLCGGALLGPLSNTPSRSEVAARQQAVLRLERLWALANVLSAPEGESPLGVRGVRYAEAQRDALARGGARATGCEFQLLGRQVQYGVLGIYGNVADGMKLVDRSTLGLTGDHGERLGLAFLDETHIPKAVKDAARDGDREVGLAPLREWGTRAGLAAAPGPEEARVLGRALRQDPVRARMTAALEERPPKKGEQELARLARIERALRGRDAELAEAIAVILPFEACYRASLLLFERVRWMCSASGAVPRAELAADSILRGVSAELREAVSRLEQALASATAPGFRQGLPRMQDALAFLQGVKGCSSEGADVTAAVLARHADVQRGKFDRGQRKLPWIEVQGSHVCLTLARGSEVHGEPTTPDDIRPHEFRTAAADALAGAGGGAR